MKNAHTIDLEDRAKMPAFWKKNWYKKTIKEINLSKMSAENRLMYELAWARTTAAAQQDEEDMKKRDAERDAERDAKKIMKALKRGKLTIEEIAEDNDISVNFVLDFQAKMTQNQTL